jgi:transglutaminase-like putative cysteine protease
MKYKLPVVLAFFCLPLSTIYSQTFSKEYGIIGKDEIELKQYAGDKDAEALVLFDYGKSHFAQQAGSFEIVFERTTRIKILSDAGIKWAEVEIPFYQEGDIYERVMDIEACTYNFEDGQLNKTPLNVSNTYDEKLNSFWNVRKFAIPDVKAGSVIEYRYKVISQYMFNLRNWEFQWKIPVVYSEYEVRMIPFYQYSWILQGASGFYSQTSYVDNGLTRQFGTLNYQDMIHKYVMKDLPAFNNEEFITSINDYIIKIDFQLSKIIYLSGTTVDIMTTWADMISDLLKHPDFGKYINKSEKIAPDLLKTDTLALVDDKQKFDYVLQSVKGNYNWDKSKGKYASKSPAKLVEEKYGNCADINLFTIGLLRGAGIEAYPVLISTRDNGKIKYDYPYSHFFNYVIILANVNGELILSDATEILSLNNRIPARCINDKGLIIKEDKVEWVGLECLFPSDIKTDIQMEISGNDLLSTGITKTATEYDALYYRNNYSDNIENVKKKLEAQGFSIIDSTITVKNQLKKELPYILSYRQTSKPEIVNEKIYLSPFLNEVISDNPLKQKERTYPIDMTYPVKRVFNSTITIPEGYQAEYIPEPQNIINQLFELKYTASNENGKLAVAFEYSFIKSVYPSTDYLKIKSYYNEIVKKGNEKIVLSKKPAAGN